MIVNGGGELGLARVGHGHVTKIKNYKETMFNDAKILIWFWNLCDQLFKKFKNIIFNLNFFVSLISVPRTPVSMTQLLKCF
jgi:hypothetical protein